MTAFASIAVTRVAADRELQRALVSEAARAPSVHNVQPARWRFEPNGLVRLFRAPRRVLPAADPSGHDVRLSLGATWEGLSIALSRRGLALTEPEPFSANAGLDLAPVAHARVVAAHDGEDPLANWVEKRRSYRGPFQRTAPEVLERLQAFRADDVRLSDPSVSLAPFAAMYDSANYTFLADPAYHDELYQWLRLKRSHRDWARDGINADCLALSAPERWVASVAFRPRVFRRLVHLRVGRTLVSEAAQIRSAAALLLFVPERSLSDFTVGRRFYRLWLELTALGLSLAPMSALADSPGSAAVLSDMHRVPASRRLVNVFRLGTPPAGVARSPRLPVDELLV